MKTPFNIISLSCFQISSQCFIVLDIRVICMQINWCCMCFMTVRNYRLECISLAQVPDIVHACMKKCVSIHVLFEVEHRTIERVEQCDCGGGGGWVGVLINTLPNSWIFPQKQVDGVIYLELRTWRFYGQNTWFCSKKCRLFCPSLLSMRTRLYKWTPS